MDIREWQTQEQKNFWKDWGLSELAETLPTLHQPRDLPSRALSTEPHPDREQTSLSPLKRWDSLEQIQAFLGDCQRCGLCTTRNKIVFGEGNPKASLFFIGEGPGADEDAQGRPFVGRSGKLLTKIIEAMGMTREEVYIANVVKCRPPGNRAPLPAEVEACVQFIRGQVEVVHPKLIVALGMSATKLVLPEVTSMGEMRGKLHPLAWVSGVQVMPTFHPAYLLRNPPAKKEVWADMKKVLKYLKSNSSS